jgi:tetratricopeptide (TPR) repeat protein
MRFLSNKLFRVNLRVFILFALAILTLVGCSVEKNTLTSKAYHNLASHYNGYFYANEEMTKVEQSYRKAMVDDYNRILRLYPKLDSAQSKTYEKELQEVVKMASIAIQRHQNSKWVDDSYILVGKARLYSLDWGNAIQTFKYVNTTSKDDDARHKAILNLVRTFTEHKEFANAQSAVDYLVKSKLSPANQKQLYLERAYLAQSQNDLDGMVRNLTLAEPLLKKRSDRPGRIYFIIGQVYQKLGFEAEAYNYYKKCLGTHPEYEVDFYARLYSAQVTEISKSRNIQAARKSFKKLLKDSKNRDFKDKIYYEMGVFEYKQKHIEPAVDFFNQSIRIGSNKRVDGEAYLRLGEMYYDTKKYELSQAYYDSAVKALPNDYENLVAIKKRYEVLDEFVKHINTIRWQDSLLVLATMDTATLRAAVKASIDAKTPKVDGKKKKKSNLIQIDQAESTFFAGGSEGQEEGGAWYFANPSAVTMGQSEFTRMWGNIVLEDNWRRSQRTVTRSSDTPEQQPIGGNSTETETVPAAASDPVAVAMADIIKQLPSTEEKKKESLKKVEDSHFALGDIYSMKLEEPANAVDTYKKLLKRFPQSTYEPEVLYRLYVLLKESDPVTSSQYADLLKNNYPESSWAKILINPDYLVEAGKAAQRQKALYAIAYHSYEQEKYDTALQVLDQAAALGKTTFTPQLELLKILITGSTQEPAAFISQLEKFIDENPGHELSAYAKKLLDSSAKLTSASNPGQPSLFTKNDAAQHQYAMVYTMDAGTDKVIKQSLEVFHKTHMPQSTFFITQEKLYADKGICLVSVFSDRSSAIAYLKLFNEKLVTLKDLKNYNFNNFVITDENLETVKRTQALNEYLNFYTRHYQTENQ